MQVAPGADAQLGGAAGGLRAVPKIQYATEVGIVPATQQQHGPAQQGVRGGVNPPAFGISRIAIQPLQGHARGVVALEQGHAFAQEAAPLEGIADRLPAFVIALPLAALGGQLQTPAQAQGPPVGTALAGPVGAFVEPGHGRGQAIGQAIAVRIVPFVMDAVVEELAQALIGEAIGAHQAIAAGELAYPPNRISPIRGFLGKALEIPLGFAPAPNVLHHHQKPMLGVPVRMGIGDRRSNGPSVGLPHQQGWPRPIAPGGPDPTDQARAVPTTHPVVMAAHSAHIRAIEAHHVGGEDLCVGEAQLPLLGNGLDGLVGGGGNAGAIHLAQLGAELLG